MAGSKKLLTRKQAAERCGLSYRSIQYAVAHKKLRETRVPSVRGARSIPRYAERDVEAFIASGFVAGLR